MQVNPTLYKKSSSGAVQQWSVFAEDDVVTVEFGQVDGKFQTKTTTCKGKNIGKANETSAEDQALKEAKAKWEKQLKKGYVENPSGESNVLLPMKVESYFKGKMADKVVFPATISPKLNGVNGECRLQLDGSIIQYSRGGDPYPLPHEDAVDELKQLMEELGVNSLNYEIYIHGEHLQDITGAVKAPHHHEDMWKRLTYNVFDLPTSSGDWKKRLAKLESSELDLKHVNIVEAVEIHSQSGIILKHDEYVAAGYEGSIVRNYTGLYEYNKRSSDVLKVKYVESAEFQIHDWLIDKNGHPVFWCKSKGGLFKAKPKGTDTERKAIVKNINNWLHKWMTVEYETLSKEGIPLKPVGIGLREGKVNERGEFEPSE